MAYNPQKKHLTVSFSDYYSDYKRRTRKSKFQVREYKKYKAFLLDVLAEAFHKVLRDTWHFVLPYGLGEFYIKEETKYEGQPVIMPQASREAGRKIYTFNNHTHRKHFKFRWDKSYSTSENVKFYKFDLFDGKQQIHRQYNIGREAIAKFYFAMGKDPNIKMIAPYSKPIKKLQEPTYD